MVSRSCSHPQVYRGTAWFKSPQRQRSFQQRAPLGAPWTMRSAKSKLWSLGLVVGCPAPLKNDGVRQLVWFFTNMEKKRFQTTNQMTFGNLGYNMIQSENSRHVSLTHHVHQSSGESMELDAVTFDHFSGWTPSFHSNKREKGYGWMLMPQFMWFSRANYVLFLLIL